jgi:lysophospholipase L1-like esterase
LWQALTATSGSMSADRRRQPTSRCRQLSGSLLCVLVASTYREGCLTHQSLASRRWLKKPRFGRRVLIHVGVLLYSLAIFISLDLGYSRLINSEASPRIAVKEYHHGLLANFEGYARWREFRYRFYTNSLAFRDFAVRQIPLRSDHRRVLLIGDSFTEGLGVTFEESYAGLLYRAGQQRAQPIEFLNAAVSSYSPVIYYKKVKYFLDRGLTFDEVVVFSDISDVQDEATSYFCIDDHAEYRKNCPTSNSTNAGDARPDFAPSVGVTHSDRWLHEHFVITDSAMMMTEYALRWLSNNRRDRDEITTWYPRAGWTIPGYNVSVDYAPLGIEGGIARSRQNMQELADLLREHNIPLTIVVYPWPLQLALDDRNSRQERIWRDFCADNCKAFIDLFPAFFAEKEAHDDWYRRLFIYGDVHLSVAGNQRIFETLASHLLASHVGDR